MRAARCDVIAGLALSVMTAVMILGVAGCGAMGNKNPFPGSLGEMLDPLFPQSPGDWAREAINPALDADKRRRAVEMLSSATWGGEKPYLRLYRVYVDFPDDDDTIISVCVRALGRHGTPEDVPRLTKMLGPTSAYKPPVYVRWEAAKALQRIHHPSAVAPLIAASTRDQDTDVRMAAVKALAQYDQPFVFDALVGALNDRVFAVRHSALSSLKTLTGQDLGPDTRQWIDWGRKHRGELFAGRQPYVWQPYEKPWGFWDKMQFWKKPQPVPPRLPAGMEQATVDVGETDSALTTQ